jgi:hypothetical protein
MENWMARNMTSENLHLEKGSVFNVGDKVRVRAALPQIWCEKGRENQMGEVINVLFSLNRTKQWCRVKFGEDMFDYEDMGSWHLEAAFNDQK